MRKNRILQQGAVYHVSGRVNNKDFHMESVQIKKLFQNILVRAKLRFSFIVENFVVMGNHYHLIIRPLKNESLSRIMQWIMSVFAINANKKLNRTGHFWGERFFSRILHTLRQYLCVYDYIDNNPFAAGLIKSHEIWKYCGKYQYTTKKNQIVEDELPIFLRILLYKTRKCCNITLIH